MTPPARAVWRFLRREGADYVFVFAPRGAAFDWSQAHRVPVEPVLGRCPVSAEQIVVHVRWWDGYLERFEATECRFGYDLLWMRLATGQNRNIPLRQVRWFSTTPESHEAVQTEGGAR